MRSLFSRIGLVLAVIISALSPIFAFSRSIVALGFARTAQPQSIILRKVRGLRGAGALFRQNETHFGGGGLGLVGSMSVVGLVLCLGLLTIGAGLLVGTLGAPELHAARPEHQVVTMAVAGNLAVKLKAVEDEIGVKQAKVAKAFELAGAETDFTKPDALKELGATDSKDAVIKLREINKELSDLGGKRDELKELSAMEEAKNRWEKDPVNNPPHPTGIDELKERRQSKSLGQLFVESRVVSKASKAREKMIEVVDGLTLKTLMTTSAGFAPESTRSGVVVDKVTRPIQLLDVIPSAPTDQAAYLYMEETTRTHSAAERAEAAAYAEDAFVFTQRSETVRSIGTSLPITDEQLEDVPAISGLVDNRLLFSLRQRVDREVLLGGGTGSDLTGIASKASIQTQAKGTDPVPDAFLKAMTLVRVTGRALPNLGIIHPTDWQGIRLLRTADGIYIWGNPSEAGPERMWGMNVVQCDAGSAGTGYVVDTTFMSLFERKGATVEVGYVGSNFTEGKKTLRATLRVAFVIYRAAAICSVTGL